MSNFFKQDKIIVGITAGLGSELLLAALLTVGLIVAGQPPMEHIRWYAAIFVPPLLLLRHYSKHKSQLRVIRTLIVILFLTFIAFMFYLLRAGLIVYK